MSSNLAAGPGDALDIGSAYSGNVARFFTPGWVLRHVLMVVVTAGCFGMAYWQWTRALEGSMLSWGYSFQWPLFGLAAVALWVREVQMTLRESRGESVQSEEPPLVSPFDRGDTVPVGATSEQRVLVAATDTVTGTEDAADSYNHYLAWLAANPDRRPTEYPGVPT
ncbi:hypothetical protein FB566_4867 [Stackebrandtia endophytica]|uniref:DNA-binding transcriptional regulator of glucitol operon n=1 Tax=Stackebrandtia endophytica TaxID=1496996 RepID=A0A543B371_9ACTN|nr:hypothetical protein FB566_4867 [Stackebrandtia endophytica]